MHNIETVLLLTLLKVIHPEVEKKSLGKATHQDWLSFIPTATGK